MLFGLSAGDKILGLGRTVVTRKLSGKSTDVDFNYIGGRSEGLVRLIL